MKIERNAYIICSNITVLLDISMLINLKEIFSEHTKLCAFPFPLFFTDGFIQCTPTHHFQHHVCCFDKGKALSSSRIQLSHAYLFHHFRTPFSSSLPLLLFLPTLVLIGGTCIDVSFLAMILELLLVSRKFHMDFSHILNHLYSERNDS